MGMSIDRLLYLQKKGFLSEERRRILDIGPQNVYHMTEEQIRSFLSKQGSSISGDLLEAEIKRLVYFSTPRPGERTTFLSEVTDLTSIEYNSFDVCPGLKTEIVDLNFDSLRDCYREYYDLVFNFGTTEHVFNQWNSFGVIHDALKVDGVIYCELPATGYLDHGYYCYTPVFFRDLANANDYLVVDLFFTPAGVNKLDEMKIDVRTIERYLSPHSADLEPSDAAITCYNIHAVLKKTRSAPFRCGLEIATAHSGLSETLLGSYGGQDAKLDALGRLQENCRKLAAERDRFLEEREAIWKSTSWRITAPMRTLSRLLRR